MSLRTRLFLIFGGLVCVLLVAQVWMFRSLTTELDRKSGDLALKTVRDFAQAVNLSSEDGTHPQDLVPKVFKIETETSTKDTAGGTNARQKKEEVIVHQYAYSQNAEDEESLPPARGRKKVIRWMEAKDGTLVLDEGDPGNHMFFSSVRTRVGGQAPGETEQTGTFAVSLDPGSQQALILASPFIEQHIPLRKELILGSLNKSQNRFLAGSMGVLVVGLILVAMAAHRVSSPLRSLALAAESVGRGNLGVQVPDGNFRGEVGVAIREFNQMSARLRELDMQASSLRQRQYLSELGEIANGLAHTLRNPLNTLGLAVDQMAALSPQHAGPNDLVGVARAQIRRIDQWVRSFLALASQGSAREEPVRLDRIVQDVVLEALQDGARDRQLDLTIAPDLPSVEGVAPELRAVVQALVVNAVEAGPPEGVVSVDVTHDAKEIRVTVIDQGPGLPPQVREKLFTPHVTTKETGSGMGLFLANRIITSRYAGSLRLEDGEPCGTRAVVRLPLARESLHG